MNTDRPRVTCDDVRDDLSEFALGTLEGRSRSRVLDHVTTCARCRDDVADLSEKSDAMLDLAPTGEPPAGFELGVVERWREETPHRPRRRHRVAGITALATSLVAVGFALAFAISGHPVRQSATAYSESAVLTQKGQTLGHVWVSAGSPSWLYMSIDDTRWSGSAWCRVTLANGRVLDVGAFKLTQGYGAWSSRIDTGGVRVISAEVTNARGVILARGKLTA